MTNIPHTSKTVLIKEGASVSNHCVDVSILNDCCHWMVGNVSPEVKWLAQVFIISQWQNHDSEKIFWFHIQCSFRNTRIYLLMPRITNKSCSPPRIMPLHGTIADGTEGSGRELFPAGVLWRQRPQPLGLPQLHPPAPCFCSIMCSPSQSRRITDVWHAELVGTWNLTRLGVLGWVPSQQENGEGTKNLGTGQVVKVDTCGEVRWGSCGRKKQGISSSLPWITTHLTYLDFFSEKKKVKVLVAQSCPTFWDPMDYSLPGSSVHGILQARILEWVATFFSRGSSWPRN